MLKLAKQALRRVAESTFPAFMKRRAELQYWNGRFSEEGHSLSNAHYEPLYTSVYRLERGDYTGKRVLDIGCGPRGSLEWADNALQRVGLDPLVPQYRSLGIDGHKMEYCSAPSHQIPYPDGHFDIVTCINALDHVDAHRRSAMRRADQSQRSAIVIVR